MNDVNEIDKQIKKFSSNFIKKGLGVFLIISKFLSYCLKMQFLFFIASVKFRMPYYIHRVKKEIDFFIMQEIHISKIEISDWKSLFNIISKADGGIRLYV